MNLRISLYESFYNNLEQSILLAWHLCGTKAVLHNCFLRNAVDFTVYILTQYNIPYYKKLRIHNFMVVENLGIKNYGEFAESTFYDTQI